MTMTRLLRATAFALVFVVAFDQTPKSPPIVAGKVDAAGAKANRQAIESGLIGAGTVKLPTGEIALDAALQLGPQHSGGTLVGTGPATIIRNAHFTGSGPNQSLLISGLGVSYIASATVTPENDAYILSDTITGTSLPWDDPSAQVGILRPGNVCYGFEYDSYLSKNPPPRKRFVIRRFDPATRKLTLDEPPDPTLLSLKWLDGSPIADVKAGDRTVRLLDASTATSFPAGRCVFVTDGPSVANGAVGEHRRVLANADGIVTLDAAVTRPYTLATLVRVDPVANLTVKNLTIAQPVNPEALPCQMGFAVDCLFDRVTFHPPTDTSFADTGLNSCGRVRFANCAHTGMLALNACSDILVDGGVWAGIGGEEGTVRCTIRNLTIRRNTKQVANGIRWAYGSSALTVQRTRIEGFGGGGTSPLLGGGNSLLVRDVTIASSERPDGNSGSWLGSTGGVVDRVASDLPLFLQGTQWRVTDSSALYWVPWAGSSGTMSACSPAPAAAAGWRITP